MNSRNNIDKMSKIKLLSIHNYDSDLVLTLKLRLYACLTFTRGHSPRDSEKNKSHHVVSRGEKSLCWNYMYQTKENLKEMNLLKTAGCPGCPEKLNVTLEHIMFQCSYYQTIRETYLPEFLAMNCEVLNVMDSKTLKLLTILDPGSEKLPKDLRDSWSCLATAYKTSRNFCYDLHMKRKKLLENYSK